MARQPYQQRPQQYQRPVAPGQYPQQQYGQQQYPQQGGPGAYARPKTNTTAWILGVMCVVFFAGFIAMLIMYMMSNPRAEQENVRANDLDAKLSTANARITQLERQVGQTPVAVSDAQLQHRLAEKESEAEKYWANLTPDKQNELRKQGDLHIGDATHVDGGELSADGTKRGCTAHIFLSNTSGKDMRNVEVRLWFRDRRTTLVVYEQDEIVPLLPRNTADKQFDFPLKGPVRREWQFLPDAESGGTAKTTVVE